MRAWDPRSGQKIFKLKGHTDNIKALQVNGDGTLVRVHILFLAFIIL